MHILQLDALFVQQGTLRGLVHTDLALAQLGKVPVIKGSEGRSAFVPVILESGKVSARSVLEGGGKILLAVKLHFLDWVKK